MRSMWKGSISFGLVTIPVKLYTATEQKDITFRQVHREDGGRIRFRRVCSLDGEEVPYEDVAKGFELPSGEIVVLTDDDMADLPLPTLRSIEVLYFAPETDIDPILLARSYFVEPENSGARAYVLLRDAWSGPARSPSCRWRCASGSRWPRCAAGTGSWCWRPCCGQTRSGCPTSDSSIRTSTSAPRN